MIADQRMSAHIRFPDVCVCMFIGKTTLSVWCSRAKTLTNYLLQNISFIRERGERMCTLLYQAYAPYIYAAHVMRCNCNGSIVHVWKRIFQWKSFAAPTYALLMRAELSQKFTSTSDLAGNEISMSARASAQPKKLSGLRVLKLFTQF